MKLFLFLSLVSLIYSQAAETDSLYSEGHINFQKWNRDPKTCCEAKGNHFAIASGGPESSKCGETIRKKKGNIIDIAVAVALCLNVERAQSTSLAGGGFLVFHSAKADKDFAVDFRETAPKNVDIKDYLKDEKASLEGGKAVATPGMVAGLYEVHKKWGKLPWAMVVSPSIELATKGFKVYPMIAEKMAARKDVIAKDPYSKNLIFKNAKETYQVGDTFVQKDLAKALTLIANKGRKAMEEGPLAEALISAVKSKGGRLTLNDLKKYEVKFREPVKAPFKTFEVVSFPPPSAGGVLLIEMLNMLEPKDLAALSKDPAAYLHVLAEVMKRAYADRSDIIGDPDYFSPAQIKTYRKVLAKKYAEILAKGIGETATPAKDIKPLQHLPKETHGTTHLSIIDDEGNAVSATLTINVGNFGAGFAVPGYGMFLNNQIDDFSMEAGKPNTYGLTSSDVNLLRPGRRPVSSMTPTIILEKGRPKIAIGGAGGSKIMSATLQAILNVLYVYPDNLKKAILAPRVYHQWLPDKTEWEGGGTSTLANKLLQKGHNVADASWMADVEGVFAMDIAGQREFIAVYDPRNQGGAVAD